MMPGVWYSAAAQVSTSLSLVTDLWTEPHKDECDTRYLSAWHNAPKCQVGTRHFIARLNETIRLLTEGSALKLPSVEFFMVFCSKQRAFKADLGQQKVTVSTHADWLFRSVVRTCDAFHFIWWNLWVLRQWPLSLFTYQIVHDIHRFIWAVFTPEVWPWPAILQPVHFEISGLPIIERRSSKQQLMNSMCSQESLLVCCCLLLPELMSLLIHHRIDSHSKQRPGDVSCWCWNVALQ